MWVGLDGAGVVFNLQPFVLWPVNVAVTLRRFSFQSDIFPGSFKVDDHIFQIFYTQCGGIVSVIPE
jgi:hypothetical protein